VEGEAEIYNRPMKRRQEPALSVARKQSVQRLHSRHFRGLSRPSNRNTSSKSQCGHYLPRASPSCHGNVWSVLVGALGPRATQIVGHLGCDWSRNTLTSFPTLTSPRLEWLTFSARCFLFLMTYNPLRDDCPKHVIIIPEDLTFTLCRPS